MSDIRVRIAGTNDPAVATVLTTILTEELATTAAVSTAPPPERRAGDRGDPVALAALILSIPSAALAVLDIAERMARQPKVQALLDRWRRARPPGVTIHVITPRGEIELDRLTVDLLFDTAKAASSAIPSGRNRAR